MEVWCNRTRNFWPSWIKEIVLERAQHVAAFRGVNVLAISEEGSSLMIRFGLASGANLGVSVFSRKGLDLEKKSLSKSIREKLDELLGEYERQKTICLQGW